SDRGRSWHEAKQPPAFSEGSARVVDHTFWLTPGHVSEPGVWYGGTSPQGLVRRRPGRHAGWTEASFDSDRSARCATYVHRHVGGRRIRIHRRRRRLAAAESRREGGFS